MGRNPPQTLTPVLYVREERSGALMLERGEGGAADMCFRKRNHCRALLTDDISDTTAATTKTAAECNIAA